MTQTRRSGGRLITLAVSGATHVAVLLALFLSQAAAPRAPDPVAMQVALFEMPKPPKPEAPPLPAPEAPAKKATPTKAPPVNAAPAKITPRLVRAAPVAVPLPKGETPTADPGVELSDAQVAGATTAGGGGAGGGGGECDMPKRLQAALRKDRMVQAAAAQAHRGKALLVWNGDWVRHPGQEGGGLATVREAIMWEVGFAPPACRAEPVRGLVLISLSDGPGAARLVVGSAQWRWSDLLFARSGAARP
ncbi:hypothetical protein [Phenylobacterium sp.]|uniref:hypothetical protein n=1 Tax=Phenylobacterium sp. TaxID=1871053 RepID=UPI00286B5CDF|nr:hypothetical protein [Phenylobacterium sp.]